MSKRKAVPVSRAERRALKQVIEVRTNADGSRTVKGIAAPFGKQSVNLGGFVEIISSTAFDRTLKENPDVLLLRQHDASTVMARSLSGTLKLRVDKNQGLMFEANLSGKSTIANDTIDALSRGDLDSMSFAFNLGPGPDADEWKYENDTLIRVLHDVDLGEISIVSFPAYPDSSVALRSIPKNLRSYLKRSADDENPCDPDSSNYDPDDPNCTDDDDDRDEDDDCECECPECLADNCEQCSAESCTDTRCERCAVQARDGLRMKVLYALRRG
jgi:HK97 family phage prohead protease